MDISKVKFALQGCFLANDTLLIEGVHGIGKSQIVEEWCNENNFHMETLFLSHQEIGDLIGMPRTSEVQGELVTLWTKPIWLQRLTQAANEGKNTLVFLDELNRAPLDVRQSALQLVLERKIHQHILPSTNGRKTMIVAATNPSDLYQTEELDSALLDRFCFIEVEPNVESWLKYARSKNLNKIVRDYIGENPSKLHWMPNEDGDEKISASPRSWSKLGDIIDNFKDIDESIHFNLIKGKIGSLASEFYVFLKNYSEVIKVEDIEKIAKMGWKQTNDINKTSEFIKELTQNLEPIQKMEMANILIEKYTHKDIKKSEDAIPLLGFLYSLEMEILASILKTLGTSKEKGAMEKYMKLSEIDFNKGLFKRIVQ